MNFPYYSLLINSRIAVQKPYYAKLKTNEWKNLEFSVKHDMQTEETKTISSFKNFQTQCERTL